MKIIDPHNMEIYGDHLWIPLIWTEHKKVREDMEGSVSKSSALLRGTAPKRFCGAGGD